MAQQVVTEDDADWMQPCQQQTSIRNGGGGGDGGGGGGGMGWQANLKLIAGLDISFFPAAVSAPPASGNGDGDGDGCIGSDCSLPMTSPPNKASQATTTAAAAEAMAEGTRIPAERSTSLVDQPAGIPPQPTAKPATQQGPRPGPAAHAEPAPAVPTAVPAAAAAAAGDRAVAALAVLSFPDLQLCHLELMQVQLALPYLPGFLGFR